MKPTILLMINNYNAATKFHVIQMEFANIVPKI
jgi:hypothetical protein